MAENKHLYLKNEVGRNDGFRKSRNVQSDNQQDPEVEPSKFPNPGQQDRLRRSHALFYIDRKSRSEKRTLDIPATIELVRINFYKVFNNELRNKFYKEYGLLVSSLEGFNKNILFEIVDVNQFKVFIKHLELFFESSSKETYQGKEYNLIALIHNFHFLSSKRRIKSYEGSVSSFSLIPPQTKSADSIFKALVKHLEDKQKPVYTTGLTSEFLEVEGLSREEIDEVVDNYDIVRTVSSSRTERRRPGQYGEERRDYGFTVQVDDNIPVVGLIDTGMTRIDPLRDLVSDINYDLTGFGAYWDESGHGTAVGSLIILGHEFITNIKSEYHAKAKIAVIKAIQQDNDSLNIIKLIEAIVDAKVTHGIRLFNLSLNDPLPKSYNSSFSDYAYLLDKIAYENDVLIFISVGNVPEKRLKELIEDEPHTSHEYPAIFYSLENGSEIHSCQSTNISEPSESLNNISVGALAGNLEGGLNSEITPGEELPAYYTRKFHYDYEQPINGTDFIKSQKNKHLNKPDLVFDAGDLFNFDSGLEVLCSPIPAEGPRYFSRSCGTSLATPLIASLAAEILKEYPSLRTQTVKALLINAAISPCGKEPSVFKGFSINLLRKLIGFGKPESKGLVYSGNNSITFVIESELELEELQTVIITIPDYINNSGNKLNFTGTLSYSFLPIKDNHLCYLPLQITFGIFKPIEANEMGKTKTEEYRIKPGITWSDDFFGVDNRLFSNVQKIDINISGEIIQELENKVSLAIKCTGKNEIPDEDRKHLESNKHKFSLVLTISELPASRANNRLYNEIQALNSIESIVNLEAGLNLEAEAG
jgi:subtilisin family serine protease